MITTNYFDLTINEILSLAAGDLDAAQLASRIMRRTVLEARLVSHGRLSTDDQSELVSLTEVTDRDLTYLRKAVA